MATHATTWFGVLSTGASALAIGTAVVKNGSEYLPATTANRASYGRAVGVAISAASTFSRGFEYQVAGVLSAALSGVGTGTANDYVIVSASGTLTRTASPGGSDDIIGQCPGTSGDVVIKPMSSTGGGGGGTTPTGTGFRRVTGGVEDAAASAVDLAGGATYVTGTLPAANGGRQAGTCTLEQFGAVGDGVTSDQAAFQAARAAIAAGTYSTLLLGSKTYLIQGITDVANPWPMGGNVIGCGSASVLLTATNAPVFLLKDTNATNRQKNTVFSHFRVEGNSTGTNQNAIEIGYLGGDGCERVRVIGCTFNSLGGRGVSVYAAVGVTGPQIVGCKFYSCLYGVYAVHGINIDACQFTSCTTGVYGEAGNVSITGGAMVSCTTGLHVAGGGNDGHGTANGTQFLHCTTPLRFGLLINGHLIDGCLIYEGTILFDGAHAGAVTFSNCMIDATTYTLAGRSRFLNCTFDQSYYFSSSLTGVNEFRNCRDIDGTVPAWLTNTAWSVPDGGTGATALTTGGVLIGAGTAAVAAATDVKAGSGFVGIGSTVATTGAIRLSNNSYIYALDSDGVTDRRLIGLTSADACVVGGIGLDLYLGGNGTGQSINGAADTYYFRDGNSASLYALLGSTGLQLRDSSGGQFYLFSPSNLAADRTITLPLLTGNDTMVCEAHTQTLTNKTISASSNTISNLTPANDAAANAVAALAIDWAVSAVHTKSLASGANTFTFSNASSGRVIIVRVTSNAGGSTVTWPTVRWRGGVAPTQSTPSKTDVYTFVHDGSNIYGSVEQDMS